jgi:hypothetical protein
MLEYEILANTNALHFHIVQVAAYYSYQMIPFVGREFCTRFLILQNNQSSYFPYFI